MKPGCILIIGASGGIGSAIAARALGGFDEIVAASDDSIAAWKRTSGPAGKRVYRARVDITSEREVTRLFDRIDREKMRPSCVVNAAGIAVFKSIEKLSAQDWSSVVGVNLTGAFLVAREAAKRMKKNGGGRIVHIGSIAGSIPLAGNAAYGAAKAGLKSLTDTINEEMKGARVRASLVTLGAVDTPLTRKIKGFRRTDMLTVEEVASVVEGLWRLPLTVRVDEIRLLPPKGVL